MSENKKYLPTRDKDFLEWEITFLKYLMSRVTKFGVPQAEYDLLEQEKNIYAQKLEVANADATRSPLNVLGKNVAKKVLDKHTRKFVKSFLINNPLLTEEDLKLLGLPIHKTTRTPAPTATEAPDFDINSSTIRRLIIHFYEKNGEHKRAKPAGQHGAEVAWVISDTPPASLNDLIHSSFDTRTPLTLEFDEPDRGKAVYLALRWENTRGLKGPWSPIQKAIIP
jgi:hypothetical protein